MKRNPYGRSPITAALLSFPTLFQHERGVYVIASTQEVADHIASMVVDGVLANLYPDKASVLAAWRAYPLPLHSRYGVWVASIVETSPEGFKIVSTKRVEVS